MFSASSWDWTCN